MSLRFIPFQIFYLILPIAFIFYGCASTQNNSTPSPLILSDAVIQENKGNIESLYKAWIQPLRTKENYYIPLFDKKDITSSELAVKDGFHRFCRASSGLATEQKKQYGTTYRCMSASGEFVGELTSTRYKENLLGIDIDSPERVNIRNAQISLYKARLPYNGPSGSLLTAEGYFKFIRLGNFESRDMVEIITEKDSNKYIPIEEVKKIEFSQKCCDLVITFRDGTTRQSTTSALTKRIAPSWTSNFGAGISIVLIDPNTALPYTRIFLIMYLRQPGMAHVMSHYPS